MNDPYRGSARRAAALLALAGCVMLAFTTRPAGADGTETLGPPSVAVAAGSGYVVSGTGLMAQPGTINIDVPGAVQQVLLYWEGEQVTPYPFDGKEGDNTIVIGGVEVTGTLIGGPTAFFSIADGLVFSTVYRADITALGLIGSGANSVSVSGLDFSFRNDGAGLLVIYDDGSGTTDIQLRDGNDLAYLYFASPLDTTVPQEFTFAPATTDRTADLGFFAASVLGPENEHEHNAMSVSFDDGPATLYYDVFQNLNGYEWDSATLSVTVPAGATKITLQALSVEASAAHPDDTNPYFTKPASFSWIGGFLALAPEPLYGSLGDFVWNDLDRDGIQDAGEPGIDGVTVNLLDCADNLLANTTTAGGGLYLFDELPAGCYTVEIDPSNVGPGGALENLIPSPTLQGGNPALDSNPDPFDKNLAEGEDDLTIDFGFYATPADFCPRTPGYWKNHYPEAWPVTTLTFGGVTYDGDGLVEILRYSGSDAASRLARHLVATLLNLASGADASIQGAAAEADAFLALYPPGSDPQGDARDEANDIKDLLDEYNNADGCEYEEEEEEEEEEEAGKTAAATSQVPTTFELASAYPNPFNPQTTIGFTLPEAAEVTLAVYDMLGRQVRVLADGGYGAGPHTVTFRADELPSGTYLYVISTPFGTATGRVVLMK